MSMREQRQSTLWESQIDWLERLEHCKPAGILNLMRCTSAEDGYAGAMESLKSLPATGVCDPAGGRYHLSGCFGSKG